MGPPFEIIGNLNANTVPSNHTEQKTEILSKWMKRLLIYKLLPASPFPRDNLYIDNDKFLVLCAENRIHRCISIRKFSIWWSNYLINCNRILPNNQIPEDTFICFSKEIE